MTTAISQVSRAASGRSIINFFSSTDLTGASRPRELGQRPSDSNMLVYVVDYYQNIIL
jgi:hypothetical protein